MPISIRFQDWHYNRVPHMFLDHLEILCQAIEIYLYSCWTYYTICCDRRMVRRLHNRYFTPKNQYIGILLAPYFL